MKIYYSILLVSHARIDVADGYFEAEKLTEETIEAFKQNRMKWAKSQGYPPDIQIILGCLTPVE